MELLIINYYDLSNDIAMSAISKDISKNNNLKMEYLIYIDIERS